MGTPTMGGILIVGAVLLSVVLWARLSNPFIWVMIFVTITTGLLGFIDDYQKVTKKSSAGVSSRFKLVFQFAVAFSAVAYLLYRPDTSEYISQLFIPSLKEPIIKDMGWFAYLFLPLVIVGCSNLLHSAGGRGAWLSLVQLSPGQSVHGGHRVPLHRGNVGNGRDLLQAGDHPDHRRWCFCH